MTIDAISTQTNIMEQIVNEEKSHFVFMVKKNNPQSYGEIMLLFETLSADYEKAKEDPFYKPEHPDLLEKYDEVFYQEKNRDRYEYRYYKICNDPACLTKTENKWDFVKSVGYVKQVRIPIEKDDEGNDITPDMATFLNAGSRRKPRSCIGDGDETDEDVQGVGVISDMAMTAKEMGKIKRNHWAVENTLHHVLDVTLREDRSPAKKSKNNLALLRKFAFNLLTLAGMAQSQYTTMPELMDIFADNLSAIEQFVFNGIQSFY